MIVSMIVAMDRNRGIGQDNRLPWRLSADLKRFKELTMGHHLIVGRKTWESIGRPLPGRKMIVVTRNQAFHPEGCTTSGSITEALEIAAAAGDEEVFIGGGAEVFRESFSLAERIYLTDVDAEVDADTFFPAFERSEWVESVAGRFPADEKNEYGVTFRILNRK